MFITFVYVRISHATVKYKEHQLYKELNKPIIRHYYNIACQYYFYLILGHSSSRRPIEIVHEEDLRAFKVSSTWVRLYQRSLLCISNHWSYTYPLVLLIFNYRLWKQKSIRCMIRTFQLLSSDTRHKQIKFIYTIKII